MCVLWNRKKSKILSHLMLTFSMDLIFPYFISNVAIGMDLQFPPQLYGMIYGGILICYLVINFLLVGRLNKLVPAEVLKNRE